MTPNLVPTSAAVAAALAIIAGPSAAVTKFVDWCRNLFDKAQSAPKWVWNPLAFGTGIGVAFLSRLDALTLLLPANVHAPWAVTQTLTGFAIGGAASGWHEFFDLLSSKAKAAGGGAAVPVDDVIDPNSDQGVIPPEAAADAAPVAEVDQPPAGG